MTKSILFSSSSTIKTSKNKHLLSISMITFINNQASWIELLIISFLVRHGYPRQIDVSQIRILLHNCYETLLVNQQGLDGTSHWSSVDEWHQPQHQGIDIFCYLFSACLIHHSSFHHKSADVNEILFYNRNYGISQELLQQTIRIMDTMDGG